MLAQVGGGAPRASDNEALIESSFRRLLASIESEREKLRSTWLSIDNDTKNTSNELEKLRQDTEDWCHAERHKVEAEWKRLDKLREKMSVLYASERGQVLEINCSGRMFSLPKSALCYIEGSYLNHMFSDAFSPSVPRDSKGRYFLDFNPTCFAIIVEYLQTMQYVPDAPPPQIPPEHQQNMDVLAEALNLKCFLRPNCISSGHGTSLVVRGNSVEATHPGWQIVCAQDPLPMSGASYFEVKILANPDPSKGGLAFGVCGHQPKGNELFSIQMPDLVMYNSHSGLVASCVAMENVSKKINFSAGSVVGLKHDISNRSLHWYFNRLCVGSCTLQTEVLEQMRVLYPVFALYVTGQKIQVDFNAISPSAAHGAGVSGDRKGAL